MIGRKLSVVLFVDIEKPKTDIERWFNVTSCASTSQTSIIRYSVLLFSIPLPGSPVNNHNHVSSGFSSEYKDYAA